MAREEGQKQEHMEQIEEKAIPHIKDNAKPK